jgi:RNA polymerase subunit RPABC4/transcription elongation factor Spt4
MPEPTPTPTPTAETKECSNCDAVIGKSEKTCPKCSLDLEELEDTVTAVERAQQILEKRRKKNEPAPAPEAPPAKAKNRFLGLGSALRKEKK